MAVWGIVVAGGQGTRFGAPKQFESLGDSRVVDHAVVATGDVCEQVVLVLPPGVEWDGPPVAAVVPGGERRSDSVRSGLAVVDSDADIVVVHDAARPLAPPWLFETVLAAVRAGADAAVPAVAVSDTIKRVERGRVAETLARDDLVVVQTPQAFRAATLRTAHAAGADATDDAALVEATGGTVAVVEGDPSNLKITSPADLSVAVALVRWRGVAR
jgi:2-C-methyl-D-erythritol 4-phosphate cytidylyltransferase